MAKSVFANFTVIKVLAHTTFVSHSNDWSNSTAITSNIQVSDYRVSRVGRRLFEQVLIFDQLSKNFRSELVKFRANKFLDCFSRRQSLTAASAASVLPLFLLFLLDRVNI